MTPHSAQEPGSNTETAWRGHTPRCARPRDAKEHQANQPPGPKVYDPELLQGCNPRGWEVHTARFEPLPYSVHYAKARQDANCFFGRPESASRPRRPPHGAANTWSTV